MPLLNENQLISIVESIVDSYGSRLTNNEVTEVIGLILEDIPGFEAIDSQSLDQVIDDLRRRYYDSVCQNTGNPETQGPKEI